MKANIQIIENPPREQWQELLKRPGFEEAYLDKAVEDIFFSVKRKGDKALIDFTKTFDGVQLDSLSVDQDDVKQAVNYITEELAVAIRAAAGNIRKFHEAQRSKDLMLETSPGVMCWQKPVAIQRVGLYIPGGSAPLFSSLLMLAVPAKIAGCAEIVVCTPPGKDGKVNPAILFAAEVAGVDEIYKVGGAQAIAAMAYGTETIKSVNKIFGPGNQFVTAAKQEVQKRGIAIDLPAGPSEVLVMADETAKPEYIAYDLLAQAEHGPDSQVILVSASKDIAEKTLKHVQDFADELPRKEVVQKSLDSSRFFVFEDKQEMLQLVNEYAPEHLIISMDNAREMAEGITNAGSVFIGNFTPESAGDYASGTNHTLPTNGFAKAYSGVSLDSFVKKITFQEITSNGLENLADTLVAMSEAENLRAHTKAVSIRTQKQ